MSRADKEFEWRMQGMLYAYNVAKENGIEGLEKDIRKRGIIKAPLRFSQKDIDRFVEHCSRNLYANMFSAFAYSLHELYGFGGDRLRKLQEYVGKIVEDVFDLDWIGEHYVHLEDFAIEMNEKYNLGIDVEAIASCQTLVDEKEDSNYHYANIDRVISELNANGYEDAAEWLQKKLD